MVSVRTRLLNGPELRAELLNARDFFLEQECAEVSVFYDTGFQVYAPRVVRTARLLVTVEQSLADGVIELGEDVVAIEDLDRQSCYRFGRDSNVSVTSSRPELIAEKMRQWTAAGLKGDWANEEWTWTPWGPEGALPDTHIEERERLRCDAGQPRHQRLGTRPVSEAEFEAEAREMIELLHQRGISVLNVTYIRASDSEPAELAVETATVELVKYIQGLIAGRACRYGEDEILVEAVGEVEVQIRKTLQVWVRDRVLMEEIRALWIERGLDPR